MPRFTRPAYIRVSADGTRTESSTGPRARDGWLRAVVTLRTADGAVSDPLTLSAGGRSSFDGAGRASIDIPASMAVHVIARDGTETVYGAGDIVGLTIRPVQ